MRRNEQLPARVGLTAIIPQFLGRAWFRACPQSEAPSLAFPVGQLSVPAAARFSFDISSHQLASARISSEKGEIIRNEISFATNTDLPLWLQQIQTLSSENEHNNPPEFELRLPRLPPHQREGYRNCGYQGALRMTSKRPVSNFSTSEAAGMDRIRGRVG